jgi:hypothetical protein
MMMPSIVSAARILFAITALNATLMPSRMSILIFLDAPLGDLPNQTQNKILKVLCYQRMEKRPTDLKLKNCWSFFYPLEKILKTADGGYGFSACLKKH